MPLEAGLWKVMEGKARLWNWYLHTTVSLILRFVNKSLILFSHTTFAHTESNEAKSSHRNALSSSHHHESQFITKNNSRVVSQRGGLAVLPCSVTMSTPATVSKYLVSWRACGPSQMHLLSPENNFFWLFFHGQEIKSCYSFG